MQPSTAVGIERLQAEIQKLVTGGFENPEFEMTRQCSLAKEDKASRVDFAKTIQGIANALPPTPRVYVVGADENGRRFCDVVNAKEFDTANLHQVLGRYLDPVPELESYKLESETGETFVAVVVSAEQRRPVVAKADVQNSDGKTPLLTKGDIWIKKNTALSRATAHDIRNMNEAWIEAEAERRAGKRFAETREAMEASFRLQWSPQVPTPSQELLFAPEQDFRAYVERLVADEDTPRFGMLVSTLRDLAVERWHVLDGLGVGTASQVAAKEILSTCFRPALNRLVYTGLLLLKHGTSRSCFERTADLLMEAFSTAVTLCALPPSRLRLAGFEVTQESVAAEVLAAAKATASYAMRMRRYEYLQPLLRAYVSRPGSSVGNVRVPFLFWPLGHVVPGHDRIAFTWERFVKPQFISFFGSQISFLDSACSLEFVLHMNSFLATEVPDAQAWVTRHRPDVNLRYWYTSDLWRYLLEPLVPLAEEIYGSLASGWDAPPLQYLSVEAAAFQKTFQVPPNTPEKRQGLFLGYLKKLEDWRSSAALESHVFAGPTDWGPVIGPAMKKAGI